MSDIETPIRDRPNASMEGLISYYTEPPRDYLSSGYSMLIEAQQHQREIDRLRRAIENIQITIPENLYTSGPPGSFGVADLDTSPGRMVRYDPTQPPEYYHVLYTSSGGYEWWGSTAGKRTKKDPADDILDWAVSCTYKDGQWVYEPKWSLAHEYYSNYIYHSFNRLNYGQWVSD